MADCVECGKPLSGQQKKYDEDECRKRGARRALLLKRFNITLEQYDQILEEQGGVCGICEKPPKAGKSFAVDHDHKTGFIRGLLCFFCNRRVLGARGAEILIKTAEYVKNPPARRAIGDVWAPNRPRTTRRRRNAKAGRRKVLGEG